MFGNHEEMIRNFKEEYKLLIPIIKISFTDLKIIEGV
jgi:hypothetical protein